MRTNVETLLANPNFELAEHDIINKFDTEVNEIYNLACPASPPHYQYNPVKTLKTSVLGIINMLELAKNIMQNPSSFNKRSVRRSSGSSSD